MGTILGILFKEEKRISKTCFEDILSRLNYWESDFQYTWSGSNIHLGNLLLCTSSESAKEQIPFFHKISECSIISDSRLDYRKTLVQELGENWDEYKDYPDSYYILKSYLKWGMDCVKHLFGDFAFAIWDNDKSELFCARDHFGIRPLYYYDHPDYFVISSDLMVFEDIEGLSFEIREQYILDTISSIVPDIESSAYSNIYKLKPAHFLKYRFRTQLQVSKYWELKIDKQYLQFNEEQAIIGLRRKFIDSVENKMNSNKIIGLELSGGLDSSSIAACLPYISFDIERPLFTYTHTLSPEQPIRPRKHVDTFNLCKDVFKSIPVSRQNSITGLGKSGLCTTLINYLEINLKPIQQPFALLSDLLYQEAKSNGVRVLLSGYGGDEGATFDGSVYLLELAYEKRWSLLRNELLNNANMNGGNYLWPYISYIIQIYTPKLYGFIRLISPYHKDFIKKWIKNLAINKSIRKEIDIHTRFLEKGNIADDPNLRKRQYKRLTSGYISDRLEDSYIIARSNRMEYRYPFLDVKLIEFFYSLKSEFKYKNGTKRYLFRMAMEGILDDRIRLSPGKYGATIPNTGQRLILDEYWFKEIILDGKKNNSFHYVDYDHMLQMIEYVKHPKAKKKALFNAHIFFSTFSVLVLQKWEREGKIRIGIKC